MIDNTLNKTRVCCWSNLNGYKETIAVAIPANNIVFFCLRLKAMEIKYTLKQAKKLCEQANKISVICLSERIHAFKLRCSQKDIPKQAIAIPINIILCFMFL